MTIAPGTQSLTEATVHDLITTHLTSDPDTPRSLSEAEEIANRWLHAYRRSAVTDSLKRSRSRVAEAIRQAQDDYPVGEHDPRDEFEVAADYVSDTLRGAV